jgi:hypothetical protein
MSKFVCGSKRKFSSRGDAYDEIKRLKYESCGGVDELRVYRCKHCKRWHLTSSVKY